MPFRHGVSIAPILIGALLGCGDNKPASIGHEALPPLLLTRDPILLKGKVLNKAGQPIQSLPVAYSTPSSELISLGADGALNCQRSGDGTVLVSGGGLSQILPVKCRMVARVEAARELKFKLGENAGDFAAVALDEAGTPLPDVPVSLKSSQPSVLAVEGRRLQPLAVGTTTITATAGGFSTTTDASVVSTVLSAPLALADGASQTWSLEAGKYEVDVEVKTSNGAPYGVTASWTGAVCDAQPERQVHHFVCTVAAAASLTVTNPSALGLGPAENGIISITRLP